MWINRFAPIYILLFTSSAAYSQNIVYSARYYSSPGSHATSHYHIYRIDPDGSHRSQITAGVDDDGQPKWSPNGHWIAFIRSHNSGGSYSETLYAADQFGRILRKIVSSQDFDDYSWSEDSKNLILTSTVYPKNPATHDYDYNKGRSVREVYALDGKLINKTVGSPSRPGTASPDGLYSYTVNDASTAGSILDGNQKEVFATPVAYTTLYWTTNKQFLGVASLDDPNGGPTVYQVDKVNIDGTVDHLGHLKETGAMGGTSENVWYGADFTKLDPWPGKPGAYLAWENWHNSTVGTDFGLYMLDPDRKILKFLAESQFAVWSPNRALLCTAPGRDLSNYQRKKDGTWSMVFTAPLRILNGSTGSIRTIQGGLVMVTGADWR